MTDDEPNLSMCEDLRHWAHDQGWTAVDLMLVCLLVATDQAARIEWEEPVGEGMWH